MLNQKPLKIVWLCHFANQEMIQYFHNPKVKSFAPWIDNLIEMFRQNSSVELHIVAPNVFTNTNCTFVKDKIHYHFYAYQLKLIPKKIRSLFSILFYTSYTGTTAKIVQIIRAINPDIVHLHGAENPYYSAGILPLLKKFPALITIQGFIRNESTKTKAVKQRVEIEEEILSTATHFGVRTQEMNDIITSLNPKATFHFHDYFYTVPTAVKKQSALYDIVFWGRVCKDKGIEDLLQAVAIVKKEKPDISLHIIGAINNTYAQFLQNMVENLGITENITWVGFLAAQQNVFDYAGNAKVCVLPTHHDNIPGTIIESMFLKLPVIAYAVGGIPEINQHAENLITVEKGDIPKLAVEITNLLMNSSKRSELAENAYLYITERFLNKEKIVSDIMNAYNRIIETNQK